MKTLQMAGIILLVLVLLVLALLLYARYRINKPIDKHNLAATLDELVQRLFAKEQSYGLVIGVYKEGRNYTKGYGSLEKEKQGTADHSERFELASSSKLFTTSVLQILCDSGILNMDDKIAVLLADQVALPAAAAHTTLRQLATHTSGFPSLPSSFLEKMHDENNPYKDLKTQDLYDYLKTCVGKKPEGHYEYSNFGMGLLGHILALKTRTSFEETVQQALLAPLGMKHTFITIDDPTKSHITQGYNEAGKPMPVWIDTVLTGAGSFLSTAADMLLFIQANLDRSHPLYSTLVKTHAPQPGGKTGLGWMLPDGFDKFAGNKSVLWHNGMAGGYASYIAIDTSSGNGIIVLSNKAVDVSNRGHMLMRLVNTQSWKP